MNGKTFLTGLSISIVVLTVIFAPLSLGYDPWVDYNDDGYIGSADFSVLAGEYGTSGTPINKTELLLELQVRIEALEARVPQNGTITISPPAFTPNVETQQFTRDIYLLYGSEVFFADVQLPHGAAITNVSACVRDEVSDGRVRIEMWITNTTIPNSSHTMADLKTGSAETPGDRILLYDDTIDYATIDNEHYAYAFSVGFDYLTSGLILYWVQIEYEY